jgi:hypothetical protein
MPFVDILSANLDFSEGDGGEQIPRLRRISVATASIFNLVIQQSKSSV